MQRRARVCRGETLRTVMRVILQIWPEVARDLGAQKSATPEANEVAEAADEMGVSLQPMHPGVEDSTLAQFFTVQVPDDAVEQVIERLRNCRAVEAAYIKPPEATP